MLDKFRAAKQTEISLLHAMQLDGRIPEPLEGVRPGFAAALLSEKEIAVIAEYKRASPSRGAINMNAAPAEVALAYAKAGASALSVLTEDEYFQGDINFLFEMCGSGFSNGLPHNLPLLRKDFIFDPLQVKMSAATPASAILLIARMLENGELGQLLALASSLGLECVVEVFDKEDLIRAQKAGAAMIQVNNRDLDTLQVDLERSLKLAPHKREGEVWISASGIETPEQICGLKAAGYDAVLVGTSLMKGENPGEALKKLRGNNA